MRIIDAESYEQALIANDWDKDTDEFSTEGVFELLHDESTIQAIIIPDNATNGDMIKAMFPNATFMIDEEKDEQGTKNLYVYTDNFEGFTVDLDWWNALYEGV